MSLLYNWKIIPPLSLSKFDYYHNNKNKLHIKTLVKVLRISKTHIVEIVVNIMQISIFVLDNVSFTIICLQMAQD